MAWQRVDSRLVKQDDPAARRVWYWDDGPLDRGELLLWLDERGHVVRFQLSHARFLARHEYLAEWRLPGALRVGEVRDGAGGQVRRSPLIRYARPEPAVLTQLADYFARNAALLPPLERAAVGLALDRELAAVHGSPMGSPAPADSGALPHGPWSVSPLRPRADAVSGRAGGTGNGTAATLKASPHYR
jgi:hypothetical protein